MTTIATTEAERFHVRMDSKSVYDPGFIFEKMIADCSIIQRRDISYRFYLHQHPYVQQLVRRLLREGTSELQAADTENEENNASLPASIEIAIASNTNLTLPGRSSLVLLADLQVMIGDVPTDLTAGLEFETIDDFPVTVPNGMKAVLVDGMTETPLAGTEAPVPDDSEAMASTETVITLGADIQVTLSGGARTTVTAGTQARLASGTSFIVPNGLHVMFLKSKPRPKLYADIFSKTHYNPSKMVQRPYPVKELDFTSCGAYAVYNWELFFHVPLTIAIHLSKNQRFAEAQRWFHYLFDPTDDSNGPTPERFWKVRPFQYTDVKKLEKILMSLAVEGDEELRKETVRSIEAWQDAPFRPHVIARYRQQAYMYKTVMAYLDNLIAWGDSLFRQDTGEAIDEAMMLYVLAANILGPRPQPVPKKGSVRPRTYANLRPDLKEFGTVMRDVEAAIPFDPMPFPAPGTGDNDRLATMRSLGKALYFCVPPNDKLLGYWDTVADRLFKIRNSLNLQGVFRQLALFEPPIDPAMLARAAAAGLDVGAIVNGLNQPLPLVRFQLLVQKATEIVQEVKSLGSNLLAAMEKEDGEALAILRAKHERIVMEMVEHVRYGQLQEAIKSKEGLLQSLALAVQRYTFYERQLDKKQDEIEQAIPGWEDLDRDSLDKMKLAMEEPAVELREIEVDIAKDLDESGGKVISSHESFEFDALGKAQTFLNAAAITDTLGSAVSAIPQSKINFHYWGIGGTIEFGGYNLHNVQGALSSAARGWAGHKNYKASNAAKIGSYSRREQDWAFQSNLAAGEISQIFKQLRAAEIREAVAEQELKNHRQQMKHAAEIAHFLNEEGADKTGKKTNKALYAWMKREVKGLYSQCFQFAFDIARKAERALQHELGNRELSYLQFGYLAGKEGLLAGEKLYLDVKRMELAYHDLNQREYELTKHVSLLQLDPLALIRLRTTGRCTVRLPESLFDMDGPGHYFRRIKTVALSIPCITGPYVSVNCTLRLLKSSIRKTQILKNGGYTREDAEDDRFDDYFGSLQAIVTSTAQHDSGLFETNLRDERYLPFENSGVISEWQLELPADPSKEDPSQFDYETISDVIFHIRYTAREGGNLLRDGAKKHVKELMKDEQAGGSVRLFSVHHEFPTEWAKFKSQTLPPNQGFELVLDLHPEHYPFWSRGRLNHVTRVDVFARSTQSPIPESMAIGSMDNSNNAKKVALSKDVVLGDLLHWSSDAGVPEKPEGEWKLFSDVNTISDLWIAVTWSE